MDIFVENNKKLTSLMIRKTLSKKDVDWLNENGWSATIYPVKKLVVVNGYRKFKLV